MAYINDYDEVLRDITNNGNALRDAPHLQNNYDIVLAVVSNNGDALKYAPNFQNNYNIVLAAVSNNGDALKYATNLKNNYDIVLAAVSNNGDALKYASPYNSQNNYDIVLAAVSNNGNALAYASPVLQDNYEIVLTAVSNIGNALRYASSDKKNNYEIVLTAVSNAKSSDILDHASFDLKYNEHIIIAAIRKYHDAIWYSPIRIDTDIINNHIAVPSQGTLKYNTYIYESNNGYKLLFYSMGGRLLGQIDGVQLNTPIYEISDRMYNEIRPQPPNIFGLVINNHAISPFDHYKEFQNFLHQDDNNIISYIEKKKLFSFFENKYDTFKNIRRFVVDFIDYQKLNFDRDLFYLIKKRGINILLNTASQKEINVNDIYTNIRLQLINLIEVEHKIRIIEFRIDKYTTFEIPKLQIPQIPQNWNNINNKNNNNNNNKNKNNNYIVELNDMKKIIMYYTNRMEKYQEFIPIYNNAINLLIGSLRTRIYNP